MIGATTLSEYKEHLQEDEALARRFRCVQVAEPTIEETRRILYQLRPRLERNYAVELLDEAIETALDMSSRYMRHLHLPDKAIERRLSPEFRNRIDEVVVFAPLTAGDVRRIASIELLRIEQTI